MGHALDTQCREVFVKAVCAKGQTTTEQVHTLVPREGVQDVLGCRVVGLRLNSRLRSDSARVAGEYEIQVWVAYDEESELIRQRVDFFEDVHLHDVGEGCLDEEPDVLVEVTGGPQVVECAVNKAGHIDVVVSFTIHVDVVGETRLFVQTCHLTEGTGITGANPAGEEWDWTDDRSHGL